MVSIRILALATLLGVPAAPAMAASFDCAKATTPFERAICETPELSTADELLAKAFATATGGLTKASVNMMRQDQRNWLDFAQRACTDDAKPLSSGSYDAEGGACLLDKFNSRIEVLGQSRMISGHRFLVKSAYGALPDPNETGNPESYWKVAAHELAFPLLDEDDPLAASFNAFVTEQAKAASDLLDGENAGDTSRLEAGADNMANIDIQEVAGNGRISLEEESYSYPHGAAHGGSLITYHHYLIGDQRGLVASDVFTGADWEKTLADLAWAQLQLEHKEWLQVESAEDIAQIVIDPARWDFSDVYGLTIQFNQYEVSAYAYGAPTITIAWDKLSDITAETQQTVLYGQ